MPFRRPGSRRGAEQANHPFDTVRLSPHPGGRTAGAHSVLLVSAPTVPVDQAAEVRSTGRSTVVATDGGQPALAPATPAVANASPSVVASGAPMDGRPDAAGRPSGRLVHRWERWLRPVAIDAAARIAAFLCMYAIAVAEHVPIAGLLRQWDGRWFLLAARTGYPSVIPSGFGDGAQSTLGFFPAFPLVIRGVVAVTGLGYEAAALLAVWVLGLVASVLVWRLLCDHEGPAAADLGTAFVVCSPAAFVLGMVYSEALLLAAVAGCLVALRREHWVLAGLCAAVATATDPLGLAVLVPCLVAAVTAVRSGRKWRALAAPVLAPAGVVAFFSYLWVHTGTPMAYYTAQRRGWQGGTLGTGLVSPFDYLVHHGLRDVDDVVKAVSTLGVAVLLVALLARRRRPSGPVVGYVVGALALAALSPIITWTPRVALRSFPVIGFPTARLRTPWSVALLGTSAMLMCVLSVLTVAGSRPFTP